MFSAAFVFTTFHLLSDVFRGVPTWLKFGVIVFQVGRRQQHHTTTSVYIIFLSSLNIHNYLLHNNISQQ